MPRRLSRYRMLHGFVTELITAEILHEYIYLVSKASHPLFWTIFHDGTLEISLVNPDVLFRINYWRIQVCVNSRIGQVYVTDYNSLGTSTYTSTSAKPSLHMRFSLRPAIRCRRGNDNFSLVGKRLYLQYLLLWRFSSIQASKSWKMNGDICVHDQDENEHVTLAKSGKSDVSVLRISAALRYAEGMTGTPYSESKRADLSLGWKLTRSAHSCWHTE